MKKPTTVALTLLTGAILAFTIFAGTILAGRGQAQQTPASNTQTAPASAAPQTTAPATQAKPSTAGASQSAATTPKKPAAKPGTAGAKTQAPLALKTQKDKVSYAIGMSEGNRLKQGLKQGDLDVDSAIVLRAIKDALAGNKLLMTDKEAQDTLTTLQATMKKNMELKQKQLADNNKKESDTFLAGNKAKEGVVTLSDGLQYKIVEAGTGPKPTTNDMVTVNYRGTLLNGTEFDSSYKRGQPATFGVGQIIKGWTEALQLMPVGSKWQIFIPPDLGYGPRGAGPNIGPNSALVFDVELLSIQPRPAPPGMPGAPAPAPTATTPSAAPAASTPAVKPTPPAPKPDAAPAPTPKPPARGLVLGKIF